MTTLKDLGSDFVNTSISRLVLRGLGAYVLLYVVGFVLFFLFCIILGISDGGRQEQFAQKQYRDGCKNGMVQYCSMVKTNK